MVNYDRNPQTGEVIRRGPFNDTLTQPSVHKAYMSWRSVLAGSFISGLVFSMLLALCVGIGGVSFAPGQSGMAWTVTAATLIAVSAALSLFAGSYIAGRISNYINRRIGAVQGLVIASIFFTVVLYQMGMALGWAGNRLSSAIGTVGTSIAEMAESPQVQDITRDLFNQLNLRSSPQEVAQGVIARLAQRDVQSARDYFAYQANITPAQAQARIDQASAALRAELEKAANVASSTLGGMGWSLFVLLLFGAVGAVLGGGLGSIENVRHPLGLEEGDVIRMGERASGM